jgi:hypothetical protein
LFLNRELSLACGGVKGGKFSFSFEHAENRIIILMIAYKMDVFIVDGFCGF